VLGASRRVSRACHRAAFGACDAGPAAHFFWGGGRTAVANTVSLTGGIRPAADRATSSMRPAAWVDG
jgi:hypothetical protein